MVGLGPVRVLLTGLEHVSSCKQLRLTIIIDLKGQLKPLQAVGFGGTCGFEASYEHGHSLQ